MCPRADSLPPFTQDTFTAIPAGEKRFSSPISRLRHILFGDVANLFSKYQKHHFYAREEPRSRRSPYGYDPSYLNEEILAEICKKEGLHFIPPYNSGVLMFNHGLHAHLVGAGKAFLWYALRLLLGISENERLARECKPALLHEVNALKGSNALAPLPYPSRNWWILDSITMLFTLGGVADLTHEALLRNDCLQNGEPYILFRPTLIHYYSNNEDSFFEHVKRLQTAGIKIPHT